MARKVRILGILAMAFGLIACIFTFTLWAGPVKLSVFISVVSGFLGFLFSTIYTLLNTKHEVNKHPFNPGIIGLLLSSTPIITFVIFMMTNR